MSILLPVSSSDGTMVTQCFFDKVLSGRDSRCTLENLTSGLSDRLINGVELNGKFWWTAAFSHIDVAAFSSFVRKYWHCSLGVSTNGYANFTEYEVEYLSRLRNNSNWETEITLATICDLNNFGGENKTPVEPMRWDSFLRWYFYNAPAPVGFNRDRIKMLREQEIVYVGGTTSRDYTNFGYACKMVLKQINVSEESTPEPELLRDNFTEFLNWTVRIYNSVAFGSAIKRSSWAKCEIEYAHKAVFSAAEMLQMASSSTGRLFLHSLKASQKNI